MKLVADIIAALVADRLRRSDLRGTVLLFSSRLGNDANIYLRGKHIAAVTVWEDEDLRKLDHDQQRALFDAKLMEL